MGKASKKKKNVGREKPALSAFRHNNVSGEPDSGGGFTGVKDTEMTEEDGFDENGEAYLSGSEGPAEEPKKRGAWVDEIVRAQVNTLQDTNPVLHIFSPGSTVEDLENANKFFDKFNEMVREENEEHDYTGSDILIGTVNPHTYFSYRKTWLQSVKLFKDGTKDSESTWKDFDLLYGSIEQFNKMNGFPEGWNLTPTWAEEILGKRDAPQWAEEIIGKWDAPEHQDEPAYDLQSLKVRAKPTYSKNDQCRVLYWWKTGGYTTDCFVEYEQGGRHIHRIEPGDYHNYDQELVPRVSTEDRLLFKKEEGKWMYTENDIDKILAVGWKIPGRNELDGDSLQHIHPPDAGALAADMLYPRTEMIIRFKNGKTTLETRGGLRRVMRRKALADRMIYKMAEERELKFTSDKAKSRENGSEKSVRFAGALSEYSIGGLRQSRRGTSPASSRTSIEQQQRRGASTGHDLVEENRLLRERLDLLEQRLQASESDTNSHYSVRSRGSRRARRHDDELVQID
ncbi:hypothetical protein AJ80_09307 [Polytolypa hystricis UAMH7299]|uniref:Uncharacterized protein n=1 Tax=Polytolypa hystricis (strain UAMH7299) TaxID=1447883 RepID=A0A2B7WJZ4_POLH7|nr:hypothetical protein AJ80_09307 [Polytolypa hystricis UAMH7299]